MSLNKKLDIKIPTERNFGYTFSVIFFLLFVYFLFFYDFTNYTIFFLSLSLIFLIITFTKPKALKYPNLFWFKLGIFLSKIINPLIMGVLFYIIFTPVSLWFKLIKRDALEKNYDKKSNTYWINRKTVNSKMTDQY